jgi:hypothetical protein
MLTQEQKELLKMIYDDKFSIGAFSGMIFNTVAQHTTNYTDEEYIRLALSIRLKIKELIK